MMQLVIIMFANMILTYNATLGGPTHRSPPSSHQLTEEKAINDKQYNKQNNNPVQSKEYTDSVYTGSILCTTADVILEVKCFICKCCLSPCMYVLAMMLLVLQLQVPIAEATAVNCHSSKLLRPQKRGLNLRLQIANAELFCYCGMHMLMY